jgi:hypothetical protein
MLNGQGEVRADRPQRAAATLKGWAGQRSKRSGRPRRETSGDQIFAHRLQPTPAYEAIPRTAYPRQVSQLA